MFLMQNQVSTQRNLPNPAARRQRDIAKPQADGLPDMQNGVATKSGCMSEGEIKKRIIEFYGFENESCKLIDEARKEFPCYKCTLRCCMCGRECHEFKQWSIKWLGEFT